MAGVARAGGGGGARAFERRRRCRRRGASSARSPPALAREDAGGTEAAAAVARQDWLQSPPPQSHPSTQRWEEFEPEWPPLDDGGRRRPWMTGRSARRPHQNPRPRARPHARLASCRRLISCGTTCEASESFFKDHGCVVSRLAATCFRVVGRLWVQKSLSMEMLLESRRRGEDLVVSADSGLLPYSRTMANVPDAVPPDRRGEIEDESL